MYYYCNIFLIKTQWGFFTLLCFGCGNRQLDQQYYTKHQGGLMQPFLVVWALVSYKTSNVEAFPLVINVARVRSVALRILTERQSSKIPFNHLYVGKRPYFKNNLNMHLLNLFSNIIQQHLYSLWYWKQIHFHVLWYNNNWPIFNYIYGYDKLFFDEMMIPTMYQTNTLNWIFL